MHAALTLLSSGTRFYAQEELRAKCKLLYKLVYLRNSCASNIRLFTKHVLSLLEREIFLAL